jgi:hypothetical protein
MPKKAEIGDTVRWVIQNNLSSEGGDYRLSAGRDAYHRIAAACDELGIEHEGIQVIPYSPTLPEFTKDGKTNIYYGATTLMSAIHRAGEPGLFFNENFSMDNYLRRWGEHMLNSEARLTTFAEFTEEDHPDESLWFVRPDADDKSFNGDVREFRDIREWSTKFMKFDNVELNSGTRIIVAPPYNIRKEWRNYVVGGKVVASSLYRERFRLKKDGSDRPDDMVAFVEARCKEYAPHRIFAIDIALTGDQYYIIECGCLNSVGLYDANVLDIVRAVSHEVSTWPTNEK